MLLLNDRLVNYFTFSGGELQVKIPTEIKEERVRLTWKPTKSDDIMLLMLTVNALQESGINDIDLDILYLPYARQDRVCSPGEAFSLKVMIQMINSLNISAIRIYDAHNYALTYRLFNANLVWHWEPYQIFARYNVLKGHDMASTLLCAPDKGAFPRVEKIVDMLELPGTAFLDKNRDPDTGVISKVSLNPHSCLVSGYEVMVVDDICDGGATFIQAAECLKEQGAADLYLYVTHGIFSKGLDELCKHYSHIYCHHVLDEQKFKDDNRLTILRRFLNGSQPAVCY